MDDYPPIGEHGLIGDLQTSALVTTDGTIDWFCCPRFDSPSIFASLLDRERGGFFRIAPDRPGYVSRQLYLPGTAVLITRFMTPDGVGELADFMPVIRGGATDRHRIVRVLRVVRGRMRFVAECQPRFDYGRGSHTIEVLPTGVAFHGTDGTELALHISAGRASPLPTPYSPRSTATACARSSMSQPERSVVCSWSRRRTERRGKFRPARSSSCSSRRVISGGNGSGDRATPVVGGNRWSARR